MERRRPGLRRFAFLLAFPAMVASQAAEIRSVQNIFKPLSTPARQAHEVTLLVLLISAAIFLVVGGLLAYTVVRFRHRDSDGDQEPPQVYGSNQIELAWTVIPILITFVLILATARTIADVQNVRLPPDTLEVRVVGHQWWWEIHYPGLGIVTANELHVPLSSDVRRRPTRLTLQSADVIHSFWVPQLAGKTDAIPNRDNWTWIEPQATGIYLGNCAEFCGTQHARMLLRVVVHPPDGFEAWVRRQQAAPAEDPGARAGRDLFFQTACVNCHRIGGSTARGVFGPDLTHLMSRDTLGAGAAPNTPEKLRQWVQDPQTIKPGCLMPDMQLPPADVDRITEYLLTLK